MGGTGAAADGGCWALQLKGPLKPAVGLLQLWVTALLLLGRTPESQGRGQKARRSFLPHPHAETQQAWPRTGSACFGLFVCFYTLGLWPKQLLSLILVIWINPHWCVLIISCGFVLLGSTSGAASGWVGRLFVSCVCRSTQVQQPKLPLWTPPHQH